MTANAETTPVILSAARTPVGKLGGALAPLKAGELGAIAVRAAVERAGLTRLDEIDEVLMGNVVSAGVGQNVARQAAILGGLPHTVGASSINKVCGAGLKAAIFAAQAIKAGDGALFVVGGVESMSNAPHLVRGRLGQMRFGHLALEDALVVDGLWCAFEDWAMGNAAEFIADEFEVTREAMDRYALSSHQKAIAAMDAGRFDAEIIPVRVNRTKGDPILVSQDEGPRRDTSLEALAKLKPAFKDGGRVTAGNAPGLNDGAAALVIASESKARQLGAQPIARIAGYAQAAVEPKFIFDAPAKAVPRLLDKIGWTLAQVDLIEINEAFAAQVLANGYALADLGWDWDKVNVNGGAIALGHALGSTGARILVTLLHALRQRNSQRGIATLCLGGGEAVALAVEML
ncbi:MAG: acetyl-CoA acetyltransferase [Candidatus Roseilinea sp.]|nr:MAG: acetyl-CoA acetyltransferase [Candidatus Roseilinea sp.]